MISWSGLDPKVQGGVIGSAVGVLVGASVTYGANKFFNRARKSALFLKKDLLRAEKDFTVLMDAMKTSGKKDATVAVPLVLMARELAKYEWKGEVQKYVSDYIRDAHIVCAHYMDKTVLPEHDVKAALERFCESSAVLMENAFDGK